MKRKFNEIFTSKTILITGAVVALVAGYFIFPKISLETYSADANEGKILNNNDKTIIQEKVLHLDTPKPLKAIYMTSCVVGTPKFREGLVNLAKRTEINSIVIDIKDFSGTISFPIDDSDFKDKVLVRCGAKDMETFIESLHKDRIYVIGRIAVFQDPIATKEHPELAVRKKSDGGVWKDYKGLSFIDVGAKPYWDYVIKLAKYSYDIGFDEINFDYVRFPSDGNMQDTDFTFSHGESKPESLREFFKYLHDQLKSTGMKTSVDIFGMTTTNTDDLNIGQVLENAVPYFDYVAPMVYPSHFPPKFNGWADPNDHVYDLIKFTMGGAVKRLEATSTTINLFNSTPIASTSPQLYTKPVWDRYKLRTWIQDFDYGGNYGPKEVREQIQATYDVGLDSWMIWAPSNVYTEGALEAQ